MASLDALGKPRYPMGRRHTRNRTSYGSMNNWLHSELSGHNLSGYKDAESRLVARAPGLQQQQQQAPRFILASQRGCQTVPEEEEAPGEGGQQQQQWLSSPGGALPDYPQYRELRQCMTERDRNRYGVNYRDEDLTGGAGETVRLPILPSPRPHDQNPPLHLQFGPRASGYDDAHKAYLKQSRTPLASQQPRLRNGKGGSTWRHLKFPMQPDGRRSQFLDGQVSLADGYRRQLVLHPELLQQQKQQQQQEFDAAQRLRQQVYDINRRPTAKRGMEYNNWLVMR